MSTACPDMLQGVPTNCGIAYDLMQMANGIYHSTCTCMCDAKDVWYLLDMSGHPPRGVVQYNVQFNTPPPSPRACRKHTDVNAPRPRPRARSPSCPACPRALLPRPPSCPAASHLTLSLPLSIDLSYCGLGVVKYEDFDQVGGGGAGVRVCGGGGRGVRVRGACGAWVGGCVRVRVCIRERGRWAGVFDLSFGREGGCLSMGCEGGRGPDRGFRPCPLSYIYARHHTTPAAPVGHNTRPPATL